MNIATILDDLTQRFKDPLPTPLGATATPIDEDVFRQSFDRWATKGQHNALASQVWNFNSTKSFLAARLPAYSDIPISDATRIVHRSVSFWTQYPMLAKDRDGLDEDDMLRAIGFLTDGDRTVFPNVSLEGQDPTIPIRWEGDVRDYEDTFRSLAVVKPGTRHAPCPNQDVIGVLCALQPRSDNEDHWRHNGRLLSTKALAQIAQRFSNGRYPKHAYQIPKMEFISLLGFFVIMLEGFDARLQDFQALLADIKLLKERIEVIAHPDLSWSDVNEAMAGGFVNISGPSRWTRANVLQRAVRAAQKVLFRGLITTADADVWVEAYSSAWNGPLQKIIAERTKSTVGERAGSTSSKDELALPKPVHVRARRIVPN